MTAITTAPLVQRLYQARCHVADPPEYRENTAVVLFAPGLGGKALPLPTLGRLTNGKRVHAFVVGI